jgi:hypothetical protein
MLQVARWLQGPIQEIEQLARDHHSQLVPHLAEQLKQTIRQRSTEGQPVA